jgi:hypothetical protein
MPGSFTTNRDVISIIYDTMKAEQNNGAADPKRMPSAAFGIVASPAARGKAVTFDLRGFVSPAGAGSVQLDIGGSASKASSAEEDFFATVTATLSADSDLTAVKVTLDLPKPDDGSAASFTLDSIDISLPEC